MPARILSQILIVTAFMCSTFAHVSNRVAVGQTAAENTAPTNSAAAATTTGDRSDQLQQLTEQAVFAFKLSFRHDRNEYDHRYQVLKSVVQAWNESNRTNVDFERLDRWLRQAMQQSVPGRHAPLPPMPDLSRKGRRTATPQSPANERRTARNAPATTPTPEAAATQLWGNPFVDDPIQPELLSPQRNARRSIHGVDVDELVSRVEGYNLALGRIEAYLMQDRPIRPRELKMLEQQLSDILSQGEFVTLWFHALPEEEQELIPELRSPEPVVKLLTQR